MLQGHEWLRILILPQGQASRNGPLPFIGTSGLGPSLRCPDSVEVTPIGPSGSDLALSLAPSRKAGEEQHTDVGPGHHDAGEP